MLWVPVTLLVVVAVSLILDLVDLSSDGNRYASLAIRGIGLFVCFLSLIDIVTN